MKTEYFKTLWALRFEKIRKNEEDSAWNYQELYDECVISFGVEDEVCLLLKQLVGEERMHEKLAYELIKICHQTHPEYGVMVE